jgi:hypothetical protein
MATSACCYARSRKKGMQTNTRELCAFICHLGARAYPPRSDVSRRGRIIAAGVGRRGPFVCRRHELGRVDREGLLHDHGGAPLAPPREELPGAWVEHGHGGGPRLLRRSPQPPSAPPSRCSPAPWDPYVGGGVGPVGSCALANLGLRPRDGDLPPGRKWR